MSKEKGQGKLASLLSAGMDDIKETGSTAGDTRQEKTESQETANQPEQVKVTPVSQEKKETKPAPEYRTRENEEIITSSTTEITSVESFDDFRQRFCGPHPGRKEQKKQPINITANNHEWLISLGTSEKANIEDLINNVLADFRLRNDKFIKKSLKLYSDKIMGKL